MSACARWSEGRVDPADRVTSSAMKLDAPATHRNRGAILAVLRPALGDGSIVLEIASGTGQHAAFFAQSLPHIVWQPSDADPANLASIEAWRAEAGSPNLRPALALNTQAEAWPIARVDAVICINMIHIAPWSACEGLMRGSARARRWRPPLSLRPLPHRRHAARAQQRRLRRLAAHPGPGVGRARARRRDRAGSERRLRARGHYRDAGE